VPYLGGVAVFSGVAVGTCVGRPVALIPLVAALAVGVSDDRFDLPAPLRLGAQLGIGALIAATQPVHLRGWIGVPLVLAASVVLINGFNLLDGLDMLAAGVGAAAAVGFAVLLPGPARLMAASLTAALIAFLWYNRPPARIYLGDGGSYLIGASMTVLLAYAWGVGTAGATGVIALALLVVPVAEVACAIVRRRRGGRSLLSGDRSHPYDLLVASGWSRTAASATYIAVEVAVVTTVAVLGHVPMSVAVAVDLAVAVVVLGAAGLVGGLSKPAETPS
jgi:UDP-GlcNAc:undecaprenyl-phosphate GlcNAc-1-phosphate transferase